MNTLPEMAVFGELIQGWDHLDPEVFNKGLGKVVRKIVVRRSDKHRGTPTAAVYGRWEPDPKPELVAV